MCADHHVDGTVGQTIGHRTGIGGSQESAQDFDTHGIGGEPITEGLTVLLGQQGGGHQHRCLASVLNGLEHGPHGHFGLTEPDVAAHQTVHGHRSFHVGLDVFDGPELVGRLLEREGLLQLPLPGGVLGEGMAGSGDPLLVEHHQLLRDLSHLRANPSPGLLPLRTPHTAEGWHLTNGVGSDGVDLVGWKVEPVVTPVLQKQVVTFDPTHGATSEAGEAGHPVVLVNDEVTR